MELPVATLEPYLWGGEGRTTDTLNAFFDVLGPEKTAALASICCDMWQPYIDVITDRAGQAVLVFDPRRLCQAVPEALVLVGHARPPAAAARLRVDAAPPPERHP